MATRKKGKASRKKTPVTKAATELEARIAGEKSCCAPKVVSEKASRGCSAA